MHVRNVRKWIHRFNEKGIEGILTKKRPRRKPRIISKLLKKL
jgi:transposase